MNTKMTLTAREAELAFRQVSSHCEAIKNWMATAVESDNMAYAKKLVGELREYQDLFAKLNGMRGDVGK